MGPLGWADWGLCWRRTGLAGCWAWLGWALGWIQGHRSATLGDLCHPVLVAARSVPAAGLSVAGTIVGCGAGRLRVGVAREPAPLFSGAPPPNRSKDGWLHASRVSSFQAWHTTRPARFIRARRTALSPLFAHRSPSANCLTAEFRACPVPRCGVERQRRYRSPRRVGPELSRRQPPASQVLLQHTMHLLPLPASLPVLPHHLISR